MLMEILFSETWTSRVTHGGTIRWNIGRIDAQRGEQTHERASQGWDPFTCSSCEQFNAFKERILSGNCKNFKKKSQYIKKVLFLAQVEKWFIDQSKVQQWKQTQQRNDDLHVS